MALNGILFLAMLINLLIFMSKYYQADKSLLEKAPLFKELEADALLNFLLATISIREDGDGEKEAIEYGKTGSKYEVGIILDIKKFLNLPQNNFPFFQISQLGNIHLQTEDEGRKWLSKIGRVMEENLPEEEKTILEKEKINLSL